MAIKSKQNKKLQKLLMNVNKFKSKAQNQQFMKVMHNDNVKLCAEEFYLTYKDMFDFQAKEG